MNYYTNPFIEIALLKGSNYLYVLQDVITEKEYPIYSSEQLNTTLFYPDKLIYEINVQELEHPWALYHYHIVGRNLKGHNHSNYIAGYKGILIPHKQALKEMQKTLQNHALNYMLEYTVMFYTIDTPEYGIRFPNCKDFEEIKQRQDVKEHIKKIEQQHNWVNIKG